MQGRKHTNHCKGTWALVTCRARHGIVLLLFCWTHHSIFRSDFVWLCRTYHAYQAQPYSAYRQAHCIAAWMCCQRVCCGRTRLPVVTSVSILSEPSPSLPSSGRLPSPLLRGVNENKPHPGSSAQDLGIARHAAAKQECRQADCQADGLRPAASDPGRRSRRSRVHAETRQECVTGPRPSLQA